MNSLATPDGFVPDILEENLGFVRSPTGLTLSAELDGISFLAGEVPGAWTLRAWWYYGRTAGSDERLLPARMPAHRMPETVRRPTKASCQWAATARQRNGRTARQAPADCWRACAYAPGPGTETATLTSGSEERDLDVWLAQKRWWAVLDLNQRPRDSRLCEFPHSVDYAFTMTIAGFRWVPSSLYTFLARQRRGLARRCHARMACLGFAEFDTIPFTVSP